LKVEGSWLKVEGWAMKEELRFNVQCSIFKVGATKVQRGKKVVEG
jgi:hypothetical protein